MVTSQIFVGGGITTKLGITHSFEKRVSEKKEFINEAIGENALKMNSPIGHQYGSGDGIAARDNFYKKALILKECVNRQRKR